MEDEYNNVNDEDEYTFDDYVMYKICPKNKELNYCYIGQTTNFTTRKRQHMKNTVTESDKKHYHLKHYETIRKNGGWDEWEIIEIEKFNGKTNLEARMREQELIEEYDGNLNSVSAFITEEQRTSTKKAITEKYRENNKELLKEQTKQYKAEHKEIIAEQMKKYREENKDKIYEKTKEYKENNKEKHQEWQKIWTENNKEILKEKRKIYDAKKKQERILEKQQNEEANAEEIAKQQEEKEANRKAKREQYNADRRLKRLQDKEQLNKD
jgi:hypothetical protein